MPEKRNRARMLDDDKVNSIENDLKRVSKVEEIYRSKGI